MTEVEHGRGNKVFQIGLRVSLQEVELGFKEKKYLYLSIISLIVIKMHHISLGRRLDLHSPVRFVFI